MNYELICQLEEAAFYRRFLHHYYGTPKDAPTYDNYDLGYGDEYPRANLLFFSDSHIDLVNPDESLDNVIRTMKFVKEAPIPFDAVIHTGDMITPFGRIEKEQALALGKRFFDQVKDCPAPVLFSKGNHDLNDWDNLPEEVITDRDWGELFLDHAEKTWGIHRQTKGSGDKSTWNYYDIENQKIRIVTLDLQDTDKTVVTETGVCKLHGGKSWYISNEQMNWIISSALNFDDKPEKDWGVIFTMHQVMDDPPFHANATDALLEVCDALNHQGTYEYRYDHPEYPFLHMDIAADFTRYAAEEKKPHIICWLIGHDHVRKNETRKGIQLIWTLNNSASMCCSDPRVGRILGTCTQNSFDVVNIDTRHRRIRIFAYGAGTTCYGTPGDRFLPEGLPY